MSRSSRMPRPPCAHRLISGWVAQGGCLEGPASEGRYYLIIFAYFTLLSLQMPADCKGVKAQSGVSEVGHGDDSPRFRFVVASPPRDSPMLSGPRRQRVEVLTEIDSRQIGPDPRTFDPSDEHCVVAGRKK